MEEAFSIMLSVDRIFKKKGITNKEVNDIVDAIENSRKTMGNLINEVKSSYNLSTELETELTEILERRNYLAHKFFKLEIQKFYSELGKREMLKFLCDFIDDCLRINNELKDHYTHYTERMGLTDEKLEQMMDEIKEAEKERERTTTNNS